MSSSDHGSTLAPSEGWNAVSHALVQTLQPESELEGLLLQDPVFLRGLLWGVPRYGHPEGEVYKHVAEVLGNIEKLPVEPRQRHQLRLIAFAHDTFKYLEDKSFPRNWEKHHGMLARRYMEQHLSDEGLLDIIELHDEAYYAWRMQFLHHESDAGQQRMQRLLDRLGDYRQLYYLFFKCDTLTGDKILAPLRWFEHSVEEIQLVVF